MTNIELLDALKANEDFEKSLCCKRKFSECIPDNVKRNICFTKDDPIFYNMFLTLEEIYTGCCKTAKIRRNVRSPHDKESYHHVILIVMIVITVIIIGD